MSIRAGKCRQVAEILEARRAALVERHRPVSELHSEDVWRGRAALASRMRLRRVIGVGLYYLGVDLASTCRALRGEAESLEREASDLRTQAHAAAQAEAAAAVASAARRDASTAAVSGALGRDTSKAVIRPGFGRTG